MSKVVLLDTGPLGMVSHPRPNREVVEWVRNLPRSGADVLVPETASSRSAPQSVPLIALAPTGRGLG
jgi:hypothetical protein